MKPFIVLLALTLLLLPRANATVINLISIANDGTVTVTNDQTNITVAFQYSRSPAGPWTVAPPPYSAVNLPNYTNSARLPLTNLLSFSPILFFRAALSNSTSPAATYDVNSLGVPLLVQSDFIELPKIATLSRFRSGEGHDYSDDFEHCRSMKHYYTPATNTDPAQVRMFSPVTGTITSAKPETTTNSGTQIWITPTNYPAFTFVLFHVNLTNTLAVGSTVTNGQPLGLFGGSAGGVTGTDIAVWVNTPAGRKLLSYFQLMPESVFTNYAPRGVTNLTQMIISETDRDNSPLNCNGQTFLSPGTLTNDVHLTPVSP